MTTFAVLATGPSMSQELADYVRGKCKVIAVSDAFKLAPWADALVSNDRNWWDHTKGAKDFAGPKYASSSLPGGVKGLPRDGIFGGGVNSGLQGMRTAQLLGAKRILLLGFDMQGTHYFGQHKHPLKNTTPKRFAAHIAQFKKWSGCPVVNCTPRSALRHFPMSTIERELPGQVEPVATVAEAFA